MILQLLGVVSVVLARTYSLTTILSGDPLVDFQPIQYDSTGRLSLNANLSVTIRVSSNGTARVLPLLNNCSRYLDISSTGWLEAGNRNTGGWSVVEDDLLYQGNNAFVVCPSDGWYGVHYAQNDLPCNDAIDVILSARQVAEGS